jgi:hypothetical protein
MPEDSSGPAVRAIYAAYDAAVQRDFTALIGHADNDHKKQDFQKGLKEASSALKAAIDIAGLSETKVPEPNHRSEPPTPTPSMSGATSTSPSHEAEAPGTTENGEGESPSTSQDGEQ